MKTKPTTNLRLHFDHDTQNSGATTVHYLTTATTFPKSSRRFLLRVLPLLAITLGFCSGCKRSIHEVSTAEPEAVGDVVRFATNAPQLAALNIEPVTSQKSPPVPLAG